ncbi:hypothetical protein, partial [Paraburkholderia sp. SIMBA_054]|uniref:hypothetical protein n=1 Tax=Paraburkholderia sp. SIMBA_054 TaxID=3085795 RepID=UPI00397BDCEB
ERDGQSRQAVGRIVSWDGPQKCLTSRAQMVELVKAGRTPEELEKEFEPTAQTIYNWVVWHRPVATRACVMTG